MTKTAAIYCRVSTPKQLESGHSIPAQLMSCMDYAKANGYSIVGDSYIDLKTGQPTNSDNGVLAYADDLTSKEYSRPGLNALRQYRDTVGFDVLIIDHFDRFAARYDYPFYLEMKNDFESNGTTIDFVKGTASTGNKSFDGLIDHFLVAKATEERKDIIRRTLSGKRAIAKKDNRYIPGAKVAYGFESNKEYDCGLQQIPEQIAVVKKMFNWYVFDGWSLTKISDHLNAKKIPTKSGKGRWTNTTVKRILENEIYIGNAINNRWKTIDQEYDKIDRIELPREHWIIIKIEPVIERSIFDKTQQILENNGKHRRREPLRYYLLSNGMIECQRCGHAYSANSKKHVRKDGTEKIWGYYRHRTKSGHCRDMSYSADELETMVWQQVVEIISSPDLIIAGYEESAKKYYEQNSYQLQRVDNLKDLIKKEQDKQSKLLDLYLDGSISKDIYNQRNEGIRTTLSDLENTLAILERELEHVPTLQGLQNYKVFAHEMQHLIQGEFSPQEKRKVLEYLNAKVVMIDDVPYLTGWFDAEGDGFLLYQRS